MKNLFSAYDYWQFWRNADDRDVKKFLNYFLKLNQVKLMKFVTKKII